MISGHGNIETAVTAIKLGAYDFIEKPFKADRLILVAERALETSRLQARGQRAARALGRRQPHDRRLARRSPTSSGIIERLGPANSRVLISGPPGSGKELAARLIHAQLGARRRAVRRRQRADDHAREHGERAVRRRGGRRTRPRRVGALEEAHGGTLYLDEVADMPLETQAKILRVLVDQNFRRVGGSARGPCRRADHLLDQPRPRRRRSPTGISARTCSIAFPSCRSARPRSPSGARTFPNSITVFHGAGRRRRMGVPPRRDRRRRDGGAAVARLAGQHPPVAQQRRAADDSGRRRPGRRDHRGDAAGRDRRAGARRFRAASAARS